MPQQKSKTKQPSQLIELILDRPDSRLDQALAEELADLSRVQIQRLIKDGHVLVAGIKKVKASLKLVGGEQVSVTIPALVQTELVPEDIPLNIIYQDEDILVIDKPAGMVVHPAVGHSSGTLVNAVLFHCPDLKGVGGELRPGIVHRLDKDTSGLILVAKHDVSLRYLQDQFRERTVKKTYLALVEGNPEPPEAMVDAPLGRDPKARKRMAVIRGGKATAREAQTTYVVDTFYENHALVRCYPHTGRTHQIRVHMASAGHSLVGDTVYGRRRVTMPLKRHFLHAAAIEFMLPKTGELVTFESPLPSDLQATLDSLAESA